MQDVILRLYELYERYHNTKESMAWLGISFYAAFTLGIIRIYTIKDLFLDPWLLWITIGVLTIVMGCMLWFLYFHYKKKRCAAKIVGKLEDFLPKKNSNTEKELKNIMTVIRKINNEGVSFCCGYKSTEVPISILLFILYATQIAFVVALLLKN